MEQERLEQEERERRYREREEQIEEHRHGASWGCEGQRCWGVEGTTLSSAPGPIAGGSSRAWRRRRPGSA